MRSLDAMPVSRAQLSCTNARSTIDMSPARSMPANRNNARSPPAVRLACHRRS